MGKCSALRNSWIGNATGMYYVLFLTRFCPFLELSFFVFLEVPISIFSFDRCETLSLHDADKPVHMETFPHIVCWNLFLFCIAISYSPSLTSSYLASVVIMTLVLQDGWSPLMRASEKGHLDIVKTLIEAGAKVNQTSKVGYVCSSIQWCY